MGYLYKGICVETQQNFLDLVAQNCVSSSGSYLTTCTSTITDIQIQSYFLQDGSAQTPWSYTPQFITCDYSTLGTADTVELAWLVVGVWVVAWGIRKGIEAMGYRK